ncbi:MAG TPA: valine--tRNA ligase [Candidatus Saccharimonadales bacterium]|nr:valine--tRNA ligase [Candidatus Saccharimonadales bacterium]
MNDRYNPKEAEERISKYWEEKKVYEFREGGKKVYAIDTPPPTISGFIHVGHVYSYSQADFIARYKRMRGYSVFYPFGLDNDGLPTELLVEKQNNITSEYVGREKFIALVETTIKDYEKMYIGIYKRLGISVDWKHYYTTISRDVQRISQYSFIELNRMGRAYRKETPTIWCPKDKTGLSQMELEDKSLKSKFVKIRFAPDVIIATTRPEMLPACVAIFISPEDKKNAKLVGRKVKVPIFGQEVEVRADRRVNPEKGTGIVMCCTFGDVTDVEWYKAYNLPLRIAINEKGQMTDGHFKGMKIKEARAAIIEELKRSGELLEEKEIEHVVNVHERCKTEIEFIVKKQWYIRYLDMKDELLELGKEIKWHPEHMKVRYDNWINGLQWDWSISRQRFFGIPLPVWYCRECDEPMMPSKDELPVNPLSSKPSKKCKCGSSEFMPEEDVMDTWATSSLTPLINRRWSLEGEISEIYPMALRPQGHDIISFWLFTTVVKCYLHTGKLPWGDAMISGYGLDPHGKPMHKSAGNTIEPIPLADKYGADALRYWASSAKLGEDASFQEKEVVAGGRLINKLWNVAKFVSGNRTEGKETSNVMDRWILGKLAEVTKDATEMFEDYNYSGAKRVAEEFFWFFCDNYLEFIKYRIYGNDKSANYALNTSFLAVLKMLAPFIPYATEEMYLNLYKETEGAGSIHLSAWPAFDDRSYDKKAVEAGDKICKAIAFIRQWKHSNGMALNAELAEVVFEGLPQEGEAEVKGAMNIRKITRGKAETEIPETGIKVTLTGS